MAVVTIRPLESSIDIRTPLATGYCRGWPSFGQTLADKFEFEGIKLVRTRVSTLRLWLQLWDTQTGYIMWQSTGEVTLASHIARAQESVSLDELARILWSRMIEDELIGKNSTWSCP